MYWTGGVNKKGEKYRIQLPVLFELLYKISLTTDYSFESNVITLLIT